LAWEARTSAAHLRIVGQHLLESDAAKMEKFAGQIKGVHADAEKRVAQLEKIPQSTEEQKGLEKLRGALAAFGKVGDERILALSAQGKHDFNQFLDKLHTLISEVKATAGNVAGAVQQLADGSRQLAGGAQAQAASLEETAASLEEMTGIIGQVKKVADLVAEITAASAEQATGIGQVNKAVTQMDSVTQQNAAQTEELSSTAQSLATQSQALQALVGQFTLSGESREPRAEQSGTVIPLAARRLGSPGAAVRRRPAAVPAATGTDGFVEF
jgi:chromosome segregation ATPase